MVRDKSLDTMNYKDLNDPKARSELITLIRVSFSRYHLLKKNTLPITNDYLKQ